MTNGDIGERLVDSLHASYGRHDGHRAAHGKGVLCAASFAPSHDAARLTTAAHLQQRRWAGARPSDDPILHARSAAYRVSVSRRMTASSSSD